MKNFYLIILLIFLITSTGNSQGKYPYGAFEVSGGGIQPFSQFGNKCDRSLSTGIRYVQHNRNFPSWYIDLTYNFLRATEPLFPDKSAFSYEVTTGPRINLSIYPVESYLILGIGWYGVKNIYFDIYSETTGKIDTTSIISYGGFSIGLGLNLPIWKNGDFLIQAKYHNLFYMRQKPINYFGVYTGISFNIR